jgi:hypothetical protein
MTTTPTVWRGNITDNATLTGEQDSGSVAALSDGSYFAVWDDFPNFNTSHFSIVARHFDPLGNPTTGDVALNPLNNSFGVPFNALEPTSTPLPIAGQPEGLAVAFTDNFNNTGDDDIYVIRTNASLVPLEPFVLIDGSVAVTNHPSITSFVDGALTVSYTKQTGATTSDVLANSVRANGTVGPAITLFSAPGEQTDNSHLATLANGNFVAVAQQSVGGGGDFSTHDILFTIHSETGATLVTPTPVAGASGPANQIFPEVAALADGGFAVAWGDSAGDSSGFGVRATVYDANGSVVQSDILVNSFDQTGDQLVQAINALPDGGFVVTWTDGQNNTTDAQRFDPAGNPLGGPVVLAHAPQETTAATLVDARSIFTSTVVNGFDLNVESSIFDTRNSNANAVTGADFVGPAGSAGDVLLIADHNGARSLLALEVANGAVAQAVPLGSIGANEHFDGAGDFNHDGLSDLLMNTVTGSNSNLQILGMSPNGVQGLFSLGAVGADLVVDGIGDFNGDGTSDILQHQDVNGVRNLQVLSINNDAVQGAFSLGATGQDWVVDGVGDFNGDGTSDVLQQSISAGVTTLQVLTIHNNALQSVTSLGGVGADWQVDGIGDFNHDGTSDILMELGAGSTKTLEILTMHNNAVQFATALGAIGGNVFVDGVGDFNGDGTSDISMHTDSGGVRDHLILTVDNNAITGAHSIGQTGIDFRPT